MKDAKNWWIFACLLPLVGYGGFIALAEWRLHGAPRIDVAIEGVDPRDLLRGRYLVFRVKTQQADLGRADACALKEGDGRHALYLADQGRPLTLAGPVSSAQCDFWVDSRFVRKTHRVYVQEDRARDLEEAVRDGRASVRLALIGSNSARVVELLIDGKVQ